MKEFVINTNPTVESKFQSYPPEIRQKMNTLRNLILETATEIETIEEVEETLKWGEPSYLTKKGSTVRIDWKPKKPDQYALYFQCTSKLVSTFREVHGDIFEYEGNRAICIGLDDKLPIVPLKECIATALQYHSVKKLHSLGMSLDK